MQVKCDEPEFESLWFNWNRKRKTWKNWHNCCWNPGTEKNKKLLFPSHSSTAPLFCTLTHISQRPPHSYHFFPFPYRKDFSFFAFSFWHDLIFPFFILVFIKFFCSLFPFSLPNILSFPEKKFNFFFYHFLLNLVVLVSFPAATLFSSSKPLL